MIVLDASAGVEMAFGTERSKRMRELMCLGEKVIAPELYLSEVSSSFGKYVRAMMLSPDEALELVCKAASFVDEFVSALDLYVEAMSEHMRLGHPPYDILYFVLTRRNAATLYTLDRKLQDLCIRNGLNCLCELNAGDSDPWTVRAEQEIPSSPRTYTREDLERLAY